ncbi:MAG TPA: SRPBCC domain-containing protein [Paucimonas sp.]|nr:SRPBCC domain-containing protein [Paucimonas sp.]
MSFQTEMGIIRWKMHFRSPKEKVFSALATDEGRSRYWAESAPEIDGSITFNILGYEPFSGRILKKLAPSLLALEYFGTIVEFSLQDDGKGGTDLSLVATQVDESIRMEMVAGWVSVLMAMKASVDHGVDLRNHDASRTWNDGYADN